ncbi:MAG: hypothetical protein HXY18_17810, partial [Bryobacteraceae bacterium]|nr:hypothetical protein [Bryobacteraceae bacterium]
MRHVITLLVALAPLALSQQPRVSNARTETRAVASLESDFKAIAAATESPAWIGYAVPKAPGFGGNCDHKGGPVQLEGDTFAAVLFRVNRRSVEKVRSFSLSCDVDGGGLPLIWLTGAKPAESLALLEPLAKSSQPEGALAAIAA